MTVLISKETNLQGLPGFSHVPSSDNLNSTCLSQGYILGVASGSEKGKQNTPCRQGRGEYLQLPMSSYWVNWWLCLLDNLLQQWIKKWHTGSDISIMTEWVFPIISPLHHTMKKTFILQQRTSKHSTKDVWETHTAIQWKVERLEPPSEEVEQGKRKFCWLPKDWDPGQTVASEREGTGKGTFIHGNVKDPWGPLLSRGKPLPRQKLMWGGASSS